ncbi:hypothetical protein [Actinocorallia lasiicapitis]
MGLPAVVGGASAEAGTKCVNGSWRLGSAVHHGDYPGFKVVSKGGAGERLRIKGTTFTYDFSAAAKIVNTGTSGGKKFKGWSQYRKTLTIKGASTGTSKGTITGRAASAKGNATYRVVITSPHKSDMGNRPLAPNVRSGVSDLVTVAKGSYTCTKKTLIITEKTRYSKADGGGTQTSKWTYRRA